MTDYRVLGKQSGQKPPGPAGGGGNLLPPWGEPKAWEEANWSCGHLVRLHAPGLGAARTFAARIREEYLRLHPLLDDLCRTTCPDCTVNCCLRAKPYFDFADLVYLHLAGVGAPGRQTIASSSDRCCYLSAQGCLLDRLRRPWICTWYLCPAQRSEIAPERTAMLTSGLEMIGRLRRQMETAFIGIVAPPGG